MSEAGAGRDRVAAPRGFVAGRRVRLAAAALVIVVLGAAVRFGMSGWPADAGGGIAYTALLFVVFAWLWPAWPAARTAVAALAVSVAVECFQLTGLPEDWSAAFGPARLVFGTGFALADLPPYAVGAGLAWWVGRRARSERVGPQEDGRIAGGDAGSVTS